MKFFEIHKYPTRKQFPIYGNLNRLYIDLESHKFYYWQNGTYVKIITTELDQAAIANKQDKLIAGNNITIDPNTNVISASGVGGGGTIDGGNFVGFESPQGIIEGGNFI